MTDQGQALRAGEFSNRFVHRGSDAFDFVALQQGYDAEVAAGRRRYNIDGAGKENKAHVTVRSSLCGTTIRDLQDTGSLLGVSACFFFFFSRKPARTRKLGF